MSSFIHLFSNALNTGKITEHKGTTIGCDGLVFDLTLKGKVKGQAITSKGHTIRGRLGYRALGHAPVGRWTASGLHEINKGLILQLILRNTTFRPQVRVQHEE